MDLKKSEESIESLSKSEKSKSDLQTVSIEFPNEITGDEKNSAISPPNNILIQDQDFRSGTIPTINSAQITINQQKPNLSPKKSVKSSRNDMKTK